MRRTSLTNRWLFGAQRLSASQRWASDMPLSANLGLSRCSTPFGITEVGIARATLPCERRTLCSTPFGITEVGMWSLMRTDLAALSAQRLSASQRWACRQERNKGADGTCSTPFGITEVGIARASNGATEGRAVLNAFRHHRGGHRHPARCRHKPRRVLNAFRHHRGGH